MFRGEQIENLAIIRRRLGVLAELLKNAGPQRQGGDAGRLLLDRLVRQLQRLFGLLVPQRLGSVIDEVIRRLRPDSRSPAQDHDRGKIGSHQVISMPKTVRSSVCRV